MTADILAGGLGTRISEKTHLKPKTNLWHILKIYSDHRINEFVICCGYKCYLIKEYFANYFLSIRDETIGFTYGDGLADVGVSALIDHH